MIYDDWKLSPPPDMKEPKVVAHCGHCNSPIVEDQLAIEYNGEFYDEEACYFERLCTDNPPLFNPVKGDDE